MNLNPVQYFLKRYHSPELKPKELKRMLNLWFPFLVNRISIISISEDFHHMDVCLKHSFWNRNPNKSIWGGSIASAMDPFFPIIMKQLLLILFGISSILSNAQDSTANFYEVAVQQEVGLKTTIERDWGREVVTYLGTAKWTSPSGKELEIKIITSYQQLTKANGFNDRSVLALVKTNNTLIKTYDMVKRLNLPIKVTEEGLVYKKNGQELVVPLPAKFGSRFCVEGLTCYSEINL